MSKVDKCTSCGAIRIVKNDICKRCNIDGKVKVMGIAE